MIADTFCTIMLKLIFKISVVFVRVRTIVMVRVPVSSVYEIAPGSSVFLKVVPTPWRCFFLILVLLVSIFQHTTSLD